MRRAIVLSVLLIACGGGGARPGVPNEPAPKPKNAAEIAVGIAGGRVSALLYAERVRGRPIASKLAALNLWQQAFEGTGIDPTTDLDRAFVTAPVAYREEDTVVVAQHSLSPEKLRTAMEVLIGKSDPPGAWIAREPIPEARVTIRGRTRVVALVDGSFIVVLPENRAPQASLFSGTGGFPDPEGSECLVASALDPAHTVAIPRMPPLPESISSARSTLVVREDGSAEIAVDGVSTSDQQAVADANYLTQAADEATSMRIAVIKIRMLEPIAFRAEGSHVRANVRLAPADVDRLLGIAAAMAPR